eukprot:8195731-Pyramimonas_sp.AAC.2
MSFAPIGSPRGHLHILDASRAHPRQPIHKTMPSLRFPPGSSGLVPLDPSWRRPGLSWSRLGALLGPCKEARGSPKRARGHPGGRSSIQ